MSITSDDIYTNITLKQNFHDTWSSKLILSGDITAGLLAGYFSVFSENKISKNIAITFDNYVNNNFWSINLHSINKHKLLLNNFLIDQRYKNEYINLNFTNITDFIWWIQQGNIYNIYKFKSSEFIQGFITACNNCEVDFRHYVLGTPYKIINGKRVDFYIESYDLQPYVPRRIPVPLTAFYTEVVEDIGTDYE